MAIFTEFKLGFDTAAACALSLVLVALSVLALAGELALGSRGRAWRTGPGAPRPVPRVALGRWTAPVLAGLALLVGLALGVPLGALVYWLARGSSSTLPSASILGRARTHGRVQRGRGGARDRACGAGQLARDPPSQPR